MALPSSYSEAELRAYMVTVTSNVAAALGWSEANFAEAVNDTLALYGVTDIVEATDIPKLRTLAKVEAWRAVADATVADYQFSADGGSFSRQQLHQQAVAALERAEGDAVSRGYVDFNTLTIGIGTVKHSDPYLTDESLDE